MATLKDLLSYDLHIHSNYVHGASTVQEIAREAHKKKLRAIAITEHVRRNLTYDYFKLLKDIRSANNEFDIKIYSGVEAKILDEFGSLDCPDEILKEVDLIVGVVHRVPHGLSLDDCYKSLLLSKCDVIGHPVNFPLALIPELKKYNKYFELNAKYPLSQELIQECINNSINFTIGSDAHSAEEVGNFRWIINSLETFGDKLNSYNQKFHLVEDGQ